MVKNLENKIVREKYYKQLSVADCVTRALAIACKMDYKEAYKLV